jgi:hypothetical protein
MPMFRPALLLVLALPLVGCGDGSNTTTFSVRGEDDNGSATVTGDANGQIAVKTNGFEGSLKLPKLAIDSKDLDIEGLRLYPGSTVRNLDVAGKDDGGRVALDFASPADPAKVRAWFRDTMAKHGYKVESDGTGLKGTTDEGKPFALALKPDGDGKAAGTLRLGS